jgi:WD40 repeat protein
LVNDFEIAVKSLPLSNTYRNHLKLLQQAIQHDIDFISRHPTCLFQCLWNSCWWHDSPKTPEHCLDPHPVMSQTSDNTVHLYKILEEWRSYKEAQGLVWLRSKRPPNFPLGTKENFRYRAHQDKINNVVFCPYSNNLISAADDGAVITKRAFTGEDIPLEILHNGPVKNILLIEKGKKILSASIENKTSIRIMLNNEKTYLLKGHRKPINCINISKDGKYLISGSDDKTARIWDLSKGEIQTLLKGHEYPIYCVDLSPDHAYAVSGSANGARLWNVKKKKLVGLLGVGIKPCSNNFSRLANFLASISSSFSFFCFEKTMNLESNNTSVAALWKKPLIILLSLCEKTCNWLEDIWLKAGQDKSKYDYEDYERHGYTVSLCFSDDSTYLASSFSEGIIKIIDLNKTNTILKIDCSGHIVSCFGFSYDNKILATGSIDGVIKIYDISSGALLDSFKGHDDQVSSINFIPDSKHLVSSSFDQTVRIFDLNIKSGDFDLIDHEKDITARCFSKDGSYAVTGSKDTTVRVWDIVSGLQKACFVEHENEIKCVAISPDNHLVASGAKDGCIRVWNLKEKNFITALQTLDSISKIEFSKDGAFLFGIDGNKPLCVWCTKRWETVDNSNYHQEDFSYVEPKFELWDENIEMAVDDNKNGRTIAYWPSLRHNYKASPLNGTWVMWAGNHIEFITLEGTKIK